MNRKPWQTCIKHPRYRALRPPRSNCEACWYLWAVDVWYACIDAHVFENVAGLKVVLRRPSES